MYLLDRKKTVARERRSRATYAIPRAPDLSKQCAGMASRICFTVQSGTWNSLPYVSRSFTAALLVSGPVSESREDSEVVDGDCRGESTGEAEIELEVDEEAEESVMIVV